MKILSIALLALLGCSGASNPESTIPAAARPAWNACHDSVQRWCRERNNGDPHGTGQCEDQAAVSYRDLATEEARQTFFRERGCTARPPR